MIQNYNALLQTANLHMKTWGVLFCISISTQLETYGFPAFFQILHLHYPSDVSMDLSLRGSQAKNIGHHTLIHDSFTMGSRFKTQTALGNTATGFQKQDVGEKNR